MSTFGRLCTQSRAYDNCKPTLFSLWAELAYYSDAVECFWKLCIVPCSSLSENRINVKENPAFVRSTWSHRLWHLRTILIRFNNYNHRRTRRGVGGGGCPPGLKIFRANSVFRASASCSKILNDNKYFNTVKNSRATLFFRANASCSKILNDKKYIFSIVNSGDPLFFRASASCSKLLHVKCIQWKTSGQLCFSGQAQLLKNPE